MNGTMLNSGDWIAAPRSMAVVSCRRVAERCARILIGLEAEAAGFGQVLHEGPNGGKRRAWAVWALGTSDSEIDRVVRGCELARAEVAP